MKYLVVWNIELSLLSEGVVHAIQRMPDYATPLEQQGKVLGRYHIPGSHGGAWIYDVGSHEELDLVLARSPVYNFARYTVYPLAEMTAPAKGAG